MCVHKIQSKVMPHSFVIILILVSGLVCLSVYLFDLNAVYIYYIYNIYIYICTCICNTHTHIYTGIYKTNPSKVPTQMKL